MEAQAPTEDRSSWLRQTSRGARLSGAVGNIVEWYDFAVFGASATLVAAALTPGGSNGLTVVFGVFGLALVVRPLGALLGAAWADRAGRRPPLLATVAAMTAATTGIGLLPGGGTAGGLVLLSLLLLRVVQGLASGAEVAVSVTYLAEHASPGRRGLWGGVHMGTMALGVAGAIAMVSGVSAVLPASVVGEWGWRVPFLAALPLGVVVLALRRRCLETPDFVRLASARSDLSVLPCSALRAVRGTLVQGFVLTAGLMSSFTLWFVYLPAHLAASVALALALEVSLGSALVGLLVLAVTAVAAGHLSDAWGRRPLLLFGLALVAAAWALAYPPALTGSLPALVGGHCVAGAGLGCLVLQSTLIDALPMRVRTLGIAASFGVASAAVGGTSPVVADLLSRRGTTWVALYALVWLVLAAVAAVLITRTAHREKSPHAVT